MDDYYLKKELDEHEYDYLTGFFHEDYIIDKFREYSATDNTKYRVEAEIMWDKLHGRRSCVK